MSIYESIRTIYRHDGWKGFYRGLSASYAGTVETALYFVIYEHIKKLVRESRNGNDLELTDCMTAAGVAKLAASCLCYPHGEFCLIMFIDTGSVFVRARALL